MAYNYSHVIDALGAPPPLGHGGVKAPKLVRRGSGASSHNTLSPSQGMVGSGRLSPTPSREAHPASPVLLQPLPPAIVLEKESKAQSELELDRQTMQRRRERELAEALQDAQFQIERVEARNEMGTWPGAKKKKKEEEAGGEEGRKTQPFVRPPEAYELYQAIDKKDLDFIARVRDHAFPMLLQKNASEFPVVYAARIGPSHHDVLILLVGAFSRYACNGNRADVPGTSTTWTKRTSRRRKFRTRSRCCAPM